MRKLSRNRLLYEMKSKGNESGKYCFGPLRAQRKTAQVEVPPLFFAANLLCVF